ncbi:MAG: flagellar biosynthesis anti-sigma factor FlgM [Acidobacteria bacterium]|nr:flagellar biosynthesis anti-sigma factor FlgM [Acidobacteriota bacterium]
MRIQHDNPVRALHGLFDRLDRAERELSVAWRGASPGTPGAGATAPLPENGRGLPARAREFAALRAALAATPDRREALVARLRAQLAAGLYRPNGRRIAEAMLDEERTMSARIETRFP